MMSNAHSSLSPDVLELLNSSTRKMTSRMTITITQGP